MELKFSLLLSNHKCPLFIAKHFIEFALKLHAASTVIYLAEYESTYLHTKKITIKLAITYLG